MNAGFHWKQGKRIRSGELLSINKKNLALDPDLAIRIPDSTLKAHECPGPPIEGKGGGKLVMKRKTFISPLACIQLGENRIFQFIFRFRAFAAYFLD